MKKPTKKELEQKAREEYDQRIKELEEKKRLERRAKDEALMRVITDHKYLLGSSLRELGEAVSHGVDYCDSIIRHVSLAEKHLHSFVLEVERGNTSKLTEDEADISACIHTYLRKGTDSPISIIMYNMIAEDRGEIAWYAFIKGLGKNLNYKNAMEDVRKIQSNGVSDIENMKACLELFKEEFSYIKKSGWLDIEE